MKPPGDTALLAPDRADLDPIDPSTLRALSEGALRKTGSRRKSPGRGDRFRARRLLRQ